MKIDLYNIGQYTDSKHYYIARLDRITDYGTINRIIVHEGIKTKTEANAWLKTYNDHGLKPVSELKVKG